MPTFLYEFRRGDQAEEASVDLPDIDIARREAVRACGEALQHDGHEIVEGDVLVVSVKSEDGSQLAEIECRSRSFRDES